MSQEQLLQYIHFNRLHNTLLVQHNTKLTSELRTENALLIQENTRMINQLRAENTGLIQENTRKIEKMKMDNAPLMQDINDQISQLRTNFDNIKNDQISQLRTDVDSIKTENSPLPRLIEDNAKLIEQLRIDLKPPLPGKWNAEAQKVWTFQMATLNAQKLSGRSA